jgi:predicted RNase H-like HicB family nuclease
MSKNFAVTGKEGLAKKLLGRLIEAEPRDDYPGFYPGEESKGSSADVSQGDSEAEAVQQAMDIIGEFHAGQMEDLISALVSMFQDHVDELTNMNAAQIAHHLRAVKKLLAARTGD